MDWNKRFSEIEAAFEVELPDRFRQFFLANQAPSKVLVLENGYVRGPYQVNFDDPDLVDLHSLAENNGIDSLEDGGDLDGDWQDLFGDYVPLATLAKVVDDEDQDDDDGEPAYAKSFLVADISKPTCPVALWDYDGPYIYPLADSLDAFLAAEPPTSPRTGEWHSAPYKEYRWQ